MASSTNKTKWLYLIILSIIWGSSFILIKKSLVGLTPFQLGALRNIITGILLFIFGYKSFKHVPKVKLKWLAVAGFLGSFFPAFLFAIAETQIDSAIVSILNSLVPLNTIILGFTLFKIHSTKRQVLGVVIGFVGTIILILKGAELNPSQNYFYAGFVIISTLMYAGNVNIIKRYLQDVKPLTITVWNYAFIIIPSVVILLFTDFFNSTSLNRPNLPVSLFYVFVLSVFGTALAKVLFNKLVHISSPVFASSVAYVMPIVALTWGVLDGENFGFIQGLASVLILFGVYLVNRKR